MFGAPLLWLTLQYILYDFYRMLLNFLFVGTAGGAFSWTFTDLDNFGKILQYAANLLLVPITHLLAALVNQLGYLLS